ncbi:hypothetical protein A4X13_0g3680 [Tilletia indica]|uniref:Seipin n=1 Tax=Tilletia indica TaxID=43049 RepID=A0A177TC65_9BASI|nr:hypothetical protein A4X13_0g3680 [Tilletia indica]
MSRMTYTPGAQQPQGIPQPQQQSPFRRHHQQQQQHRYSYPPHRQPQPQPQQQQPATKLHIPHQQTWVDTLIYTLDALPPPTTWPSHILDTCLIQPLTFILAIITSPRTHRLILRLSLLTTVFWTALALAIAAYIAFYNAWVPHLGLRVPVYLQYGEQGTAPWADVYFDPPGKFFADDQQYDVTLELTVPLTPANLDLGNFMVSINMYADSTTTSEPVIISSRPTLLHPSASALNALSSFLSRNPNPDISPFGISAPGGAVSSSYSGPPLTLLSVPLLRRAILQVGSASSIPTSPPSPPKSKSSSLQRERTPSANGLPGQVGVRHPSQSIARARITVGRSDAERYWMYGGGHGHGNGNGNGGKEAFVSRGELQTHAVSLRFDAHLTGLRFFMYHYPLTSFFTFTSLFLACELAAAFFVAGIFALYSTIANSNIDVRTSDEAFVTPSSIKRDGEKRVKPEDGGVKREGGYQEDDEDEEEEEEEGAGEAESLTTTSSALGVYDEDEDDDDDEVLDDELEDTPEERAYRRQQMGARARARVERASTGAGGGEYDDSDETERELEMGVPSSSRRAPTSTSTSTSTSQPSGVGAPPLGPGRPGERRVLGRLDEETEEETDQTATTTTTSRRATASAGMGTPVSSSSTRVPPPASAAVAAQGTPEIGFGTEEEEDEEEGEERRAQRTRARWEAWSASQGGSTSVPPRPPPVEAEAEAEGEHSPSASWESVGAEEEEEEEEVDDERAAMAEAASLAEARRLKEEEAAAATGEGEASVAGPSGTSRRAALPTLPVPEAEAVPVPAPVAGADVVGPSLAEAARAEDELSTATEEEGEEGAKTAG